MTSFYSRTLRFVRNPAIATALAIAGTTGMLVSQPAYAQEEEQPEIKLSKDFTKSYNEIKNQFDAIAARQDIIDKVNASMRLKDEARASARAELAQIMATEIATLRAHKEKISNQSDRFAWGYYATRYGVLSDNPELQFEGIVEETASGLQTRTRKAEQYAAKGIILFDRGDFAGARQAFQESLSLGNTDPGLQGNIALTYLRDNDREGALKQYNSIIEDAATTGKPNEDTLIRAFQLANELGVDNLNDYAINLVRYYPGTTKNWTNAIIMVRGGSGLSDEATFDLQRLMLRTESFRERYDVETFVKLANTTRRPQEILDAIDAGVAAGFVNRTDPLIADAIAEANEQLEIDETELDALDADARKPNAQLVTVSVAGDAFLNYGQPEKAEELYRIAMSKPGANVPLLTMRLGIAQLDQGKYDEARATFAEVSGANVPVAMLWSLYADTLSE